MRAYCRFRNIPIPETFLFYPLNSEAVLLHWRPLIHLVQLLTGEQYQQFRNQEEYEEIQQGLPIAINSHCHLDRMERGKVMDPAGFYILLTRRQRSLLIYREEQPCSAIRHHTGLTTCPFLLAGPWLSGYIPRRRIESRQRNFSG